MCFVGLGTDHVIANMYFIPLGIFLGAPPPLTVRYYIWKSMIPSGLGNIVGGGLFTGVLYWYLFLHNEDVPIHFDNIPSEAAGFSSAPAGTGPTYTMTEGKVVQGTQVLPDSGNQAQSGIARDYHVSHFKKDNSASDSSV